MVDGRRVPVASARPLASSSRAKVSMSARRTGEQRQGPRLAPAGELELVEDVHLAGQPAVAREIPGEREALGVGEKAWTGMLRAS